MPAKSFSLVRNDDRVEYLIGFLCLVVYAGTLFFPLLDKDAAHHANIALHMYRTGDYFSLVDRGKDYLDKPHFLFWTTLASFKIFGVTTVAHRLPAVLFALVSVYSTYRLSLHLSGRTIARIAALILATAQAFVLSISDARMETPLTAAMIFGLWQWIRYIDEGKFLNLLGGTLGLAVAFATKGWLGPVVDFVVLFSYILINKQWQILGKWQTWLFIPLFFLLISPVLYAYYLQYDLHPEKVIRGRNNISGVAFILWGQLFERYKGFDEGGRYSDPFFLYHTFLWAFFPWSIIAYIAIAYWLRRMFWMKKWNHSNNFAVLAFTFILVALSFSKFKMPHYLIMLFPLATLFTASFLGDLLALRKGFRFLFSMQAIFAAVVILAALALNFYFFKPVSWVIYPITILLMAFAGWLAYTGKLRAGIKTVYLSACVSVVFNFLLYYNFFPQLLRYQAGNEMARRMRSENIAVPDTSIKLLETNAHSFDFYRGYDHPIVSIEDVIKDSSLASNNYFLLNRSQRDELQAMNLKVDPVISQRDYNVAKVSLKFLKASTRAKRLDTLYLAKIYRR
jgi:4-amino-4-deoxy-L-arabinose transferase-like glycosyltransferase